MKLKVYHEEEWQSYPAKTYEEYTYEWAGEPHASESIKLDRYGNEIARNPIRGFQGWSSRNGSDAEYISGHHVKFPTSGVLLDHYLDVPEGATSVQYYFWIRGTERYSATESDLTGLHFTHYRDDAHHISVSSAPNDGEWHLIEKEATLDNVSEVGMRFNSSGNWSARDVELKEVQVTFDNAPRPEFFDGDSPSDRAWVDFQPRNISGIKRIWPRSSTPPPAGTHYAWLGTPHASESIKLIDGEEVAQNQADNPRVQTSVGWRPNVGTAWDVTSVNIDDHPKGITTAVHSVHSGEGGHANQSMSLFDAGGSRIYQSHAIGVWVKSNVPATEARSGMRLDPGVWTWTMHYSTSTISGLRVRPDDSSSVEDMTAEAWATGAIIVAGSEEYALPLVQTFFDGDTESDRANDLWYNSEGVPHEWVNGQGWVEL